MCGGSSIRSVTSVSGLITTFFSFKGFPYTSFSLECVEKRAHRILFSPLTFLNRKGQNQISKGADWLHPSIAQKVEDLCSYTIVLSKVVFLQPICSYLHPSSAKAFA